MTEFHFKKCRCRVIDYKAAAKKIMDRRRMAEALADKTGEKASILLAQQLEERNQIGERT
jgi:hypothetical protein